MPRARQRSGESDGELRPSGFGRVEEIGAERLRVTTLWSPLPVWIPAMVIAALTAAISAVIAAAMGSEGDSLFTVVAGAGGAGYFGSTVVLAVLGASGGDRQVLLLDLDTDKGQVKQSLLWRWKRTSAFDLDDVDRVYVWSNRGLSLRLTRTHMVAITFEARKPLSMGQYHTSGEAMAMASRVGSFLDVPIRRNEKPRRRKET